MFVTFRNAGAGNHCSNGLINTLVGLFFSELGGRGSFGDLDECTKCHGGWPSSDAEIKGV